MLGQDTWVTRICSNISISLARMVVPARAREGYVRDEWQTKHVANGRIAALQPYLGSPKNRPNGAGPS